VYIKQVMLEDEHRKTGGAGNRIIRYLLTQLKVSYVLLRERKADAYIFFLAQSLILPILTLKLMRRKVILVLGASALELARFRGDRLLVFPKIEEKNSYKLADRIILYSEHLINQWNLAKYRNKISIVHRHFLDFNKFKIEKQLGDRANLVGYIGRFSQEKGVLNFMEAIPEVLEARDATRFLVGGDGQLQGKIKEYLSRGNLVSKVNFAGWIPHDGLAEYLNDLKLLVLPSYTEGLPSIVLEAMACGTPVLAAPEGAIPDMISDGENGFIMEDNSPQCIARNVIRVLNHPNLEQITRNARAFVEREFTFEKAVERYRDILSSLNLR